MIKQFTKFCKSPIVFTCKWAAFFFIENVGQKFKG